MKPQPQEFNPCRHFTALVDSAVLNGSIRRQLSPQGAIAITWAYNTIKNQSHKSFVMGVNGIEIHLTWFQFVENRPTNVIDIVASGNTVLATHRNPEVVDVISTYCVTTSPSKLFNPPTVDAELVNPDIEVVDEPAEMPHGTLEGLEHDIPAVDPLPELLTPAVKEVIERATKPRGRKKA